MPKTNNENKNFKKSLFNHTKENYQIMEQVIIQSNKAGFDEWQREKDQTPKSVANFFF
ncbi:MAG: hypothetical protein ACYS0I_18025 [Planctomycetota bacterium]